MKTNKINKYLNSDSMKIVVIILLILNVLLTVYVSFFKRDAVWLETLKSGGSDNFQLVKELYSSESYKTQQTDTLNQVLGSMKGEADTPEVEANMPEAEAPSETNTLSQNIMNELLSNTFIDGNENARFIIFEYSDFLCPFCKRHQNDQTLKKVIEKYPNDVAHLFKNMPLVQLHPSSFLGAEAVECAGKLGGKDAFYKYINKAFLVNSFDNDNIVSIAKEIGLNTDKFTSCVTNGEFKSKIDGILQEANNIFGINGTPGNVILDKETGKYVIISGAYPFEKFDEEIQNLMK